MRMPPMRVARLQSNAPVMTSPMVRLNIAPGRSSCQLLSRRVLVVLAGERLKRLLMVLFQLPGPRPNTRSSVKPLSEVASVPRWAYSA